MSYGQDCLSARRKGGKKVYENQEQEIRETLRRAKNSGVSLFLEGKPATPEVIAGRCVCEEAIYMADYVLDASGTLKELRYDKVTEWK